MTRKFDPNSACLDPTASDGRCTSAGVYPGESPVDAALCGRYNTETGVDTSACSGLGHCGMRGVEFVEVVAVDPPTNFIGGGIV